jgi:periplasmic divalent cation tolerance protein
MTDAVVVFCTCRDEVEADRIAVGLLKHRLAACITMFPAVKSVYRWRGNIESAQEVLLLVKSTLLSFPALKDFILSAHSYDTPEVIALPVVDGSEHYLAWIGEEVGQPGKI